MATQPKYNRLSKDDAAVLLVDHQAGLLSLVNDFSPDEFRNNILALADTAKYFGLPTILTTSFENGPNGPLMTEQETRAEAALLVYALLVPIGLYARVIVPEGVAQTDEIVIFQQWLEDRGQPVPEARPMPVKMMIPIASTLRSAENSLRAVCL